MTMKAVRIHQYGDPEVLKYEDAPIPQIQAGQVLIKVHAAGVNPVDNKTRAGGGISGMLPANPFPLILGWDAAGIVAEVTPGSAFAIGDRVYGMVGFPNIGSAYAEYVVAHNDEIARVPENVDLATAASVPLVALTAWQAIFDTAHLQPGQRILIHGAAGGVGHMAVQLAKWKGAHVIGTASASNREYLEKLGVDEYIDYNTQRFEEIVNKVDVVLDTVSDDTLTRSIEVVKPGGFLVSITRPPDAELTIRQSIHGVQILVKTSGEQLAQIAELMANGHLQPTVDCVLPLTSVAEAHRLSETRHVRGKIVLRVVE